MTTTRLAALAVVGLAAPSLASEPLATCPVPKISDGVRSPATTGNPRAREAAQRGLQFLSQEMQVWQDNNKCFGCHVHAVTLEAMAIGRHNQYRVPRPELQAVVDGMLKLPGGARGPHGFAHETNRPFDATAKAFGGAAFARYDQWIGQDVRHDLLKVAGELVQMQKPDGGFDLPYVSLPVMPSRTQAAYQAAQTFRRVYALTADDQWLLPLERAETFLRDVAQHDALTGSSIQEINYALMGLSQAGAGGVEDVMQQLSKRALARQNQDGGWGLNGEASNAFATGQTLYALRQVGLGDRDPVVARGTEWLITHQNHDGGWSRAGFDKAEAMWGVLGLVSVDVLSIAAGGVEDGQHVEDTLTLKIEARDNTGAGVRQVELSIDELPVARACGAELAHAWDTRKLEPGKHVVEIVAENAKGESSRRRLEVYAGPVYLTQIGSRSETGGTQVSLRDIAGARPGVVEVEIVAPSGETVATQTRPSAPGPMTFQWDGRDKKGALQKSGKYVARLRFKDGDKVLQSENVPFVRDSEEAQKREYSNIKGKLTLPGATGAAAAPSTNTQVDLVDERGRVLQSVRSTDDGQYRFRNVDAGHYKVRIQKKG
ncbi:MAG TPA: FlgD immunoglobulin-like domain containing protein, partial [Polyangia bacterium]|nr:FlgD immunoglobulin-like domain containing protein [Polyangia bacterium]